MLLLLSLMMLLCYVWLSVCVNVLVGCVLDIV